MKYCDGMAIHLLDELETCDMPRANVASRLPLVNKDHRIYRKLRRGLRYEKPPTLMQSAASLLGDQSQALSLITCLMSAYAVRMVCQR